MRNAHESHRRVISMLRSFGWPAVVSAMVTIAEFDIASPSWPVRVCVTGALAVAGLVDNHLVADSAESLRSLATMEQSLPRWFRTTPAARRNRIDVLDLCDVTTDAVLLQPVGAFRRYVPANVRLSSARTITRSGVVNSAWQPYLPTAPFICAPQV
jgi:hypothetical protein